MEKYKFKNNCRISLRYYNEKDKDGLIIKGYFLTIDRLVGNKWLEITKRIKGRELNYFKKLLSL